MAAATPAFSIDTFRTSKESLIFLKHNFHILAFRRNVLEGEPDRRTGQCRRLPVSALLDLLLDLLLNTMPG